MQHIREFLAFNEYRLININNERKHVRNKEEGGRGSISSKKKIKKLKIFLSLLSLIHHLTISVLIVFIIRFTQYQFYIYNKSRWQYSEFNLLRCI